ADFDFTFLVCALADPQIVGALHVLYDRLVQLIAGHAHASAKYNSGERNKGDLRRASTDIDDHVASGILHWKSHADCCCHRFFDQINFPRTGMRGTFAHRALFHLSDSGGNRDHDSRSRVHTAAVVYFGNEMSQHRLRHFEVGNHAILQWAHRDDIRRRPAEHSPRLVTDRQHFVRAGLHCYDRWLAQYNPLIFYVNKGVRRADVEADVAG